MRRLDVGKTAMAKLKKSAGKTSSGANQSAAQSEAARQSRSITESAQQIWLAGMGAFNRAQAEGSRLFESLVRDGLSLEQTARRFAGNRVHGVKGAMEDRVGQAKERAADTWDKLEKVFEERVQRALVKLGVPGRDDLNALTERVERLTATLKQRGASVTKPAAGKSAKVARPAATKKASSVKPKPTKAKPAGKTTKVAKTGKSD
ncbi:phasin family protein [Thermomonas sp.]|uniref:phasin family protein n=1 Tax=Thermomonas sp. TaxID=1971895 RepID=UPI0026044484|nr:phasin family protein [Thermomonas sp.]